MPEKASRGRSKQVKLPPPNMSLATPAKPEPKFSNKKIYIVVLLLAVGALLLAINKGWVIAALVNGRPIFRWQLNSILVSRFGQQTLEGLIGEMLIADAAATSGVNVSPAEIEAKQQEVVKGLGGNVKIEDLLRFQGMTKSDFDNQIRLQLMVEKLLSRDLVISDADIDNFIATSSATLTATEPGKLRDEARQAIISQKVSERLQTWFLELKDKAKITRFL